MNRGTRAVALVSPAGYPLGGVAVWLAGLSKGLIDRGYAVRVILTGGRYHDADRYREQYAALPSVCVLNPTGSEEGRVFALERSLAECSADLVIGVNIADTYRAVNRLKQRDHRVRVAMSLHAVEPALFADARANAGALDAVLATNRLTQTMLSQWSGFDSDRVLYAPYGVDAEQLKAAGARQRDRSGTIRLAWTGRLEDDQKRVRLIPRILDELDRRRTDYRLLIAGDGPDRDWLLERLSGRLATGQVRWLGSVAWHEVADRVYRESDTLLITSHWETGPIVAWEAMACGLAVVSTAYIGSGLERALESGTNCLLFPLDDAVAGADALIRASDAGVAGGLVEAGRRLVANRYTTQRSLDAWATAIDTLLAREPRPPVDLPPVAPRGRLDRLLGVGTAEQARRLFGVRYEHQGPGGEWPHTNHWGEHPDNFWATAQQIDRCN